MTAEAERIEQAKSVGLMRGLGVLEKVILSKKLVFILLWIPLARMVYLVVSGEVDANPIETLTLATGNAAGKLLILTLLITPLGYVFPKTPWVKRLVRHRRYMGVACFGYALLHFAIFVLDWYFGNETLLKALSRPFTLIGFTAFLILLPLALTSNNFSLRKLKFSRWKRLHRTVYLAAFLIVFHMSLKEKAQFTKVISFFLPLVLLEGYRVYRYWKSKTAKAV